MKFQYTALALAACLGTVVAQGMDGLPDCAKTCASDSIPDHCQLIDVGCICGDKSFITNISCCVAKSCSSDKQAAAIKFANQICKGGGVTDLPQSASCANGDSTATGQSSASSGASTSSDSTKTETGATATTSGASATQGTATASPTAGSTGSSTSANPAATTTAGAAHIQSKDTGVLAAVGAALFAFLV